MLLIVLGAWAAIIPFIGPLFHYSYSPDKAWHWTSARGWLEVLPGAVAVLAGVMLLVSANRVTASAASWLGIAAGAWLVVGRDVATWWGIGSPGTPTGSSDFRRALESLGLFSAIGAAILGVAAVALGRLSIRSVRDVRAAQRRKRKDERRRRREGESAYEAGRRDEAMAHQHDLEEGDTFDDLRTPPREPVRRPGGPDDAPGVQR